ncbi:disease resistance-like protein DSC1 isoform X2 [Nymphaea colorata]|uniref:disease resistance-like protein DSC1 isoform X2 n=1 Tax=Nymphaea colorata TaxID=210225 RepID=UPI00214EE9C3|nr:disease resistance-like protein DSC1 isoform X2 [Nymphaea colorata]
MALQSNMAGPSRSTLSSNHGGFEYDVFLSFRGEDTRHTFTGLFHYILVLHGIHAYFDEEDLHKGERIEEILVAITRSKILVPIFSKRYSESHWCLKEVAKMVECQKDGRQEKFIIPVFFDVDPKDVRCQSGPFEAAFHRHQTERRDNLSEVDGWKHALTYVGGISGFDLKSYNGDQRELVNSITADMQNILATKMPLYEKEYLVGLETRVEKMLKCLDFQSKHARIVGIHGIGGVGKTTLARAIYNRNRRLFGASSFIENVRKESNSGLIHLQKQLIQDMCEGKDKVEINTPSQATKKIKHIVGLKTVLLVFDDVDDKKQLEALAGDISWFGPGSRIIITTRQVGVLQLAGLQEEAIYMLEALDEEESLQLFNHHAFGDREPGEEYIKLSKSVLSISSGIPLILEVFGSLFRTEKSPEEWNELLKELRLRQHSEVHEKLRICYDRLNDNEKIIFLDIACLLIRKSSEDAIYVWEDQKLSPHLVIKNLQNKSLIKIKNGKFEMHDQIRDMGREIVLKESPPHTGSYSRLWCEEDVIEALTKSQGNKVINRGILLNLNEESKVKLSIEAFELMSELRLLLINFAIFNHSDFGHFPASLKWLEWKNCPLEALPLEIKFKNLVVLNLSRSFIGKLWSETETGSSSRSTKELFDGLKVIDLSCCGCLEATPNFAMAPNLEKLILDECSKLKEVDDSIGSLKKLVFLSMRECVSLEELPNEIYGLSSLIDFNLEGCSNLVAFPQFSATNSTTGFSKLKQLILRDCQSLKVLPDLHKFQSLRSLHIDGCQLLDHKREHLFKDVKFREWDELSIFGSRRPSYEQEFCFLLPVGSMNDPLLLQQLKCHGYGDICENEVIKLHVHYEDITNWRFILETMREVHCDNSMYKDDVYDDCYAINFDWNDKINEAPRGNTIILKVRTANNSKLTRVDVKFQKRSKFSGVNMKPFVSISRRDVQIELFIFVALHQVDKFDAIEYSMKIEKHIDDMLTQLRVEQILFFDWTIEEVIILTLIFCDTDASWYEQRHGTRLPQQETAKVFNKLKVLNLSSCKFLVKAPDLSQIPNLEELILDHCECLLEIGESIGLLKNLILLSMVGCANLGALPYGSLQLNSLQLLSLEGCSKIKILPEAGMMDVRLESLQRLILDHCTSLTEIPDYVGGLKCLHCLSLKGCSSLKEMHRSIGSLVVLEELILDHCTALMEMPDDFGGLLKCLRRLSLEGCFSLERLPLSIMSLVVLEELILNHCTSLMEIPENVGRLKCLRRLSLEGCSSLRWLPLSIISLVLLEELILDHCPSLTKIPDVVGELKCLRRLSLQGCCLLRSIGRSATTQPDWLGNFKSLIYRWQLKSVPDLSNLTALEELNLENCRRLVSIHGLQKLRSLKVLHMNGCWDLDVHKIWSQLKAFSIGSAFSIGFSLDGERVNTISLPFSRGGCMRNEPLQLKRMDVFVWKLVESETMDVGDRVEEDDSVLNVGVAVGSRLFPAAPVQMALQLREDLEAQQREGPYYRYWRSYTTRFGKDRSAPGLAWLLKLLDALLWIATAVIALLEKYDDFRSYTGRFWEDRYFRSYTYTGRFGQDRYFRSYTGRFGKDDEINQCLRVEATYLPRTQRSCCWELTYRFALEPVACII